jgi:Ca-activated chloride channel family protein
MRRAALFLAVATSCVGLALFGPGLLGRALLSLGLPSAAAPLLDDPAWEGAALLAAGRWGDAAAIFAAEPGDDYNLGHALARQGRYDDAVAAFARALAARPDDADAAYNKALLEAALKGEAKETVGGVEGARANSPGSKTGGARDRPRSEGGSGGIGDGLAAGRETESEGPASGRGAKDGKGAGARSDDARAGAPGAAGASDGQGRGGDMNGFVAQLLRERESRVRRRLQMGAVHPTLEWLRALPDDPGRFLKLRISAEKARRLRAAGGAVAEDD